MQKYKKNSYLFSLFITLSCIEAVQASEYAKCILKAKANGNGCTRYFSVAWNSYVNQSGERQIYVSFALASDENVQYSNTTHQSWYPDLTFTHGVFQNPDYKLVKFSPNIRELKREGITVNQTKVLDYAQSLNYRSTSSSWWTITRNDHEGRDWTIDLNYPLNGAYHTFKAATNGKDSNLQCKVMYYSDTLPYNYDAYYTERVIPGLVNYDPVQNHVVGNEDQFNNLIMEYKGTKPVSDSCSIS